jgi:hypothetical protein
MAADEMTGTDILMVSAMSKCTLLLLLVVWRTAAAASRLLTCTLHTLYSRVAICYSKLQIRQRWCVQFFIVSQKLVFCPMLVRGS